MHNYGSRQAFRAPRSATPMDEFPYSLPLCSSQRPSLRSITLDSPQTILCPWRRTLYGVHTATRNTGRSRPCSHLSLTNTICLGDIACIFAFTSVSMHSLHGLDIRSFLSPILPYDRRL